MFRTICVLVLIISIAYHEDAASPNMTIMEIIRSYGYPGEEYQQIKTEDGYLLTMHRIPYGTYDIDRVNRPVVFLMHGILGSSVGFVNMGPGVSIAYDLVEAGYDVWMGNARGNKFSRRHDRLHPLLNRRSFWSFSWHEIGYYDLPAMIDFVLNKTKQSKLSYIGHSQGTTCFFVMGSKRPKYVKRIKIMVALAPIVYMEHVQNPLLRFLSKLHHSLKWGMSIVGWYEFLPGTSLLNAIAGKACGNGFLLALMCKNVYFTICGADSKQLNRSTIPMIVANTPAGAATRQFIHYAQAMTTGEFREYDHGRIQNLLTYRSRKPPLYNLANLHVPVSLIYADNDKLSAEDDVLKLKSILPHVVDTYRVPFHKFTHLDYLFGKDVKKLVNDHVVEILEDFK